MIRSLVYDALILRLTSRWYAEVLRRVPEGAALLDVGIGTAGALLANAELVSRKGLRITGIDVDADYLRRARRKLRDSPLAGRTELRLESVYTPGRRAAPRTGLPQRPRPGAQARLPWRRPRRDSSSG